MTINNNVVRRFAYMTRTDLLKEEPAVTLSAYKRYFPQRSTIIPPTIKVREIIIEAVRQGPLSQMPLIPIVTTLTPIVGLTSRVDLNAVQIGSHRRDHRILQAHIAPRTVWKPRPAKTYWDGLSLPVAKGETSVFLPGKSPDSHITDKAGVRRHRGCY
jgi:hypothetical protein